MLERLGLQERFDCWNRGEFDAMQEMYADDAVLDVSAVFPDVAALQGREAMLDYWRQLRDTWDGVQLEPLEVHDVGRWRYVVHLRLWGRGRRSGAEADQRFAFLYTLRADDAKVVRAQLLPDLAAAFAAADV